MNEMLMMVSAIEEALLGGHLQALATVVTVLGSAYRREGAKLLIGPDGTTLGLISGGCLEGEVAEVAREVMASGRPCKRRYDMREDAVFGLGSGCGGVVEVLIEPLLDSEMWRCWLEALRTGRTTARAVIHAGENADVPLGTRLVALPGPTFCGDLEDAALDAALREALVELLTPGASTVTSRTIHGAHVLLEVTTRAPELVIFGAGLDAVPLAELASRTGFAVQVVDPRTAFLTADAFPNASRVLAHPSAFEERVSLDRGGYAVVMNHHFERDQAALRFAIEHGAAYVGVLGPATRFRRMLAALAEAGFSPSSAQLERLHNPVGLDIGAEGPQEIAVSILAEVLAVRRGAGGGMMREGRAAASV